MATMQGAHVSYYSFYQRHLAGSTFQRVAGSVPVSVLIFCSSCESVTITLNPDRKLCLGWHLIL